MHNRDTETISLALEHIFYTYIEILAYLVLQECTKKVLHENLAKRKTKNLSSFPLSQPCLARPTFTADP